jgi:hypothetical protein
LNISWDFDVLGKVIRKRGRFTVYVPPASDLRVAEICLTLITPKPRSTNLSEMSSGGVVNGKCRGGYRLLGFWIEGEVWEVTAFEVKAHG